MKIPSKRRKKPIQIDLDLEYKGIAFFQRLRLKVKRISLILDQFSFWRSALLWFVIFINTALSIYTTVFIYNNQEILPPTIPLLSFIQNPEQQFIKITQISLIIIGNLTIQFISIIISARNFFKLKYISHMILVSSLISTIILFISIYKTLIMVLP